MKPRTSLALATLAVLVVACQPAEPVAEPALDYAAMYSPAVNAYFDAWNTGNTDPLNDLFSPDFRRVAPGQQVGSANGLDELQAVIEELRAAYSDATVTNDESYYLDGTSFHHWTFSGTNDGPLGDLPPTGARAEVSGLTLMRYQDGKAVEEIVYWDDLDFNQQLGFVLVPPESGDGTPAEG